MSPKPLLQRDKVHSEDFQFQLPEELIAQYPPSDPAVSRLLVIDKASGEMEHTNFQSLPEYLNTGDMIVVNDTKVFPARFRTIKEETGDEINVMLLRRLDGFTWEVTVKPPRKVRIGNTLRFSNHLSCDIIDNTVSSGRVVQFSGNGKAVIDSLEHIGHMPLPPYIQREPEPADSDRYQTLFAERNGSIAAPSALLHFSNVLLKKLHDVGVAFEAITLHLGQGHFEPITVSEISKYTMQSEHVIVQEKTAEKINFVRNSGGRVIAGGASVVRALESSWYDVYGVIPKEDWTDLFIFPPATLNSVDGLISNFHLPQSKTMMLQSTLLSPQKLMDIYQIALKREYKFGAFGDSLLIV